MAPLDDTDEDVVVRTETADATATVVLPPAPAAIAAAAVAAGAAAPAANAGAAMSAQEVDGDLNVGEVRVLDLPELGGAAVAVCRTFRAGETVFKERALVVAAAPTNLARARAYCLLSPSDQASLRENYFGDDPGVRCAATAACRPESCGTGDSAVDVLNALRTDGFSSLTLPEVESVIRVFNLNAYDGALGPTACKVAHSCAPNVLVRVDHSAGTIQAVACRQIAEGEILGSWYFQDTGLWWMGADVRRAIFESDRGFQCACVRCRGPDICRSLPCTACVKGFVVPEGAVCLPGVSVPVGACEWFCKSCGHRSAGDAVRRAAEAEVAPRVLLELKPPRNKPRSDAETVVALGKEARARLGLRHWATAAISLVLHFRTRPTGGALDPTSVAHGCRFLGWLIDSALPMPPAAIVRTPVAVAMDCASWLAPVAQASSATAVVGDRRCVAGRLLTQFLLPLYDASGAAIAEVAGTGTRVATLRAWLAAMQGTCGRAGCGRSLASNMSAGVAQDGGVAHTAKTSTGDDAGTEAPAPSMACSRCKQVRYCSQPCQQADWKDRHKSGCLSASESLTGDAAWAILVGSST
eukprot:TRINITY_DN35976_c0_g1_i1.p1 TRINITY_DN35976_c0_g1~~TRINITY_DN35976_c0_g1_i1.p1  ORF type:complete len:607 (+),score=81.40 TRINITY_DN35976_c0_g1_i1:73-1821(+)